MLTIIVTGTERGQLTLEMIDALKSAESVILHTERCGCAEWLKENGIEYQSLDDLYDSVEDFDEHAVLAAERVLSEQCRVCYCVMNERDESLKKIITANKSVGIIGPVTARALAPVTVLSALDFEQAEVSPSCSVLVTEIDTRMSASEVKLRLMDVYGDEALAYITNNEGKGAYIPLENLDRLKGYNHKCSCLVNPTGIHTDFSGLIRQGNLEFYENNDNDMEALAIRLCDVVRCMCAGIAHGEFTAQEIIDSAMEELSNE